MDVHDMIANELLMNKSLATLIWLIDKGRELEFLIDNCKCFITKDNAKKDVSLWVNNKEQSFSSVEELIQESTISNEPFLLSWNKAIIETLF